MKRRYNQQLIRQMNQNEDTKYFHDMPYTFKPVPDDKRNGVIDPRVYETSKAPLWMLQFMPEKVLDFDLARIGVEKARIIFDSIKSVDITKTEIIIDEYSIKQADNETIPLFHYHHPGLLVDAPTLFYLHGGGFFAGHHGVNEAALKYLSAKFNYHVLAVDYRLAPEYPYPTSHDDCLAAYNWIRKNADKLEINLNAFYIAGDSAGGNLAYHCTTHDQIHQEPIIKAQMLLYPTVNMARFEDEYFEWSLDHYEMEPSQESSLAKMIQLFGVFTKGMPLVLKTDPKENDTLNPYSKSNHPQLPPTLLIVGEHDYFKVEDLAFMKKIKASGTRAETIVYGGMNHAFFDYFGVYPQAEDCLIEMHHFFQKKTNVNS